MTKKNSRNSVENILKFAIVAMICLKISPYIGAHTEFVPFRFDEFIGWIFSWNGFLIHALLVGTAIVINLKWMKNAGGVALVLAGVIFAAQFCAMAIPFDGRFLEGVLRYLGVTNVDFIADVKVVLSLASPLSAWLVFWIDARVRRARNIAAQTGSG